MRKKVYGIFVAGGSGTRMGSQVPKQFLDLGGKPVLFRTVMRFVEAIPDINIIMVLPKAHFDTWKQICQSAKSTWFMPSPYVLYCHWLLSVCVAPFQ